jgi:hypothetical protein
MKTVPIKVLANRLDKSLGWVYRNREKEGKETMVEGSTLGRTRGDSGENTGLSGGR